PARPGPEGGPGPGRVPHPGPAQVGEDQAEPAAVLGQAQVLGPQPAVQDAALVQVRQGRGRPGEQLPPDPGERPAGVGRRARARWRARYTTPVGPWPTSSATSRSPTVIASGGGAGSGAGAGGAAATAPRSRRTSLSTSGPRNCSPPV